MSLPFLETGLSFKNAVISLHTRYTQSRAALLQKQTGRNPYYYITMHIENLTLTPAKPPVDGEAKSVSAPNGGGDDVGKTPRLPRWTRQEILVLIQGKRVAENRVRRGRTGSLAFGSGSVEPKWASVSTYCKRHGVNRGPVQCRKRWSNLAGDYKKIKEWESQVRDETESFWVMRNDLRREKKLPGFFDREVYDILDGGGGGGGGDGLALALAAPRSTAGEEAADMEMEAVFDSGRSAAADDGLFSDFEQSGQEEASESPVKDLPPPAKQAPPAAVNIPAPSPISEKQFQPVSQGRSPQGAATEKQPSSNPDLHNEGRKRKRFATDRDEEEENIQHQLLEALERNGQLLSSHIEAQNTQFELDRKQQRDHANSLIAVLNKLADALGRIADKL